MLFTNSHAQRIIAPRKSDYFVAGQDTTYCKDLVYGLTIQGYLKLIEYTDKNGKEHKIKGRKNVPDITTFYIDGRVLDRTPKKAHNPNSYVHFAYRIVDGKLRVLYSKEWTGVGMNATYSQRYNVRYFVKLPDGRYYDLAKKGDIKKYLKPYLLECEAFRATNEADFSGNIQDYIEIIRDYNIKCK